MRDLMLGAILAVGVVSCYSANEAHKHAHEIINACVGHEVFDEHGRRIEEVTGK
jgi:hypothetical protein